MYTISVFGKRSGRIYIIITPANGSAPIRLDPLKPTERAMRDALKGMGRTIPESMSRDDLTREFMWVFDHDIHTALVAAIANAQVAH